MTDLEKRILEKSIWQASRGDKAQFIELLGDLFRKADRVQFSLDATQEALVLALDRIEALESRRGPGRPKGS
jgi:hypothetical protein